MFKKYFEYKLYGGDLATTIYNVNRRKTSYDITDEEASFSMGINEFMHTVIQDSFRSRIHINKLIEDETSALLRWENNYNELTLKAIELNVNFTIAITNGVSFRMMLKMGKALEHCDYHRKEISLRKKHKRKNNLLVVYAIKNRTKGN